MPVTVDLSYLAKTINNGPAIFSTRFGKDPPRIAVEPFPPVILRFNPYVDVPMFVSNLRRVYPLQCKAVKAPIDNLYQYFDHYDLYVQNADFIQVVLQQIALENKLKTIEVLKFVGKWKFENLERFNNLSSFTLDLFTEQDKRSFDKDFLDEALVELKLLRETCPVPASEYNCQTT